MRRVRMLAGNWKMNKLNRELEGFFQTFAQEFGSSSLDWSEAGVEVMFAVPYPLLSQASSLGQRHGLGIAAQNVHWETAGAYTGEVSIPMLGELGVSATLIGHSERRQYFGETDETVNLKIKSTLAADMLPILCVGETLAERKAGITHKVIAQQMEIALNGLQGLGKMVIAYEPVWAIGTGLSATSAEAQEVHALIRSLLAQRFSLRVADATRLIYGGSANPQNIAELLAMPDIDGALVGGASLKPQDFAQMVKAGLKAAR